MWLKKLVAISMIVTLIGMNAIAAIGIFSPAEVWTSCRNLGNHRSW